MACIIAAGGLPVPKRAHDKGEKKPAYSPVLVVGNAGPH